MHGQLTSYVSNWSLALEMMAIACALLVIVCANGVPKSAHNFVHVHFLRCQFSDCQAKVTGGLGYSEASLTYILKKEEEIPGTVLVLLPFKYNMKRDSGVDIVRKEAPRKTRSDGPDFQKCSAPNNSQNSPWELLKNCPVFLNAA